MNLFATPLPVPTTGDIALYFLVVFFLAMFVGFLVSHLADRHERSSHMPAPRVTLRRKVVL